jgi:hypothetical protein
MSYSNASKVYFEPIRSITYADITDDLESFADPFANPVRIIDLFNDTDHSVYISFNGIDNHIYLPAHSGRIYDYAANKQAISYEFNQQKQTQLYITYVTDAPTLGAVYVTVIYGSTD